MAQQPVIKKRKKIDASLTKAKQNKFKSDLPALKAHWEKLIPVYNDISPKKRFELLENNPIFGELVGLAMEINR